MESRDSRCSQHDPTTEAIPGANSNSNPPNRNTAAGTTSATDSADSTNTTDSAATTCIFDSQSSSSARTSRFSRDFWMRKLHGSDNHSAQVARSCLHQHDNRLPPQQICQHSRIGVEAVSSKAGAAQHCRRQSPMKVVKFSVLHISFVDWGF
jgi:hypothetical protein